MRKKSIEKAAGTFSDSVDEILEFTKEALSAKYKSVKKLSDKKLSNAKYTDLCFDLAIIRLYREFENFMLHCLIALINNDSSTLSERQAIDFPRHMNVKVCEYLIRGDGYFDFRGRDGLIKKIKQFVPSAPEHWFLEIVKKCEYKDSLNQLIALRNFAAHNSPRAKKSALESTNQEKMSSSGAWLKIQEPDQRQTDRNRFTKICKSLKEMAEDIKTQAPY